MTQNEAVEESFDRSVERWTQSSGFMGVFTHRAWTSFHLDRSVAKLIRKNLNKKWEAADRAKESLASPVSFPQASSSSSKSSEYDKHRKHAKYKHIERVEPHYTPFESKEWKDHKQQSWILSTSSRSSSSLPATPLSSDWKSVRTHPNPLNAETTVRQLSVPQTVKKYQLLAVDYQTYRLSDRSQRSDDTVLSNIAKSVEKRKLLMKAHFLSPKDPVSIIDLLATFNWPAILSKSLKVPQCRFYPTMYK